MFFIALKNSPLVNLIFHRGQTLRETFCVGRYNFTLYQKLQHIDVCRYVVRLGNLQYYFSFLGIDSVVERDTNSNVNFIHVVWRNIEAQYAFRRHAITILPDQDGFTIRLPRIPQYDVPIGGWTFSYGCTICSGVDRDQVHPLTDCIPPAEACSFNICIRRPLSLKTLSFHAYFTLVHNTEQFGLTQFVTYSEYRAACSLGRVDIEQRLTSEFPAVTLMHTFTSCPSRPCHATCSPEQA